MVEIQSISALTGDVVYYTELASEAFYAIQAHSKDQKHFWGGYFGYCAVSSEVPRSYGQFVRLTEDRLGLITSNNKYSCGELTQTSYQDPRSSDIVEDYRPLLSSGRRENPCHHEQLIGSFRTPPIEQSTSVNSFYTATMSGSGAMSGYNQCNIAVSGYFMDNVLMDGSACVISQDLLNGHSPQYKTEVEWHGRKGCIIRKYKRERGKPEFTLTSEYKVPACAAGWALNAGSGYSLYDPSRTKDAIPECIGRWRVRPNLVRGVDLSSSVDLSAGLKKLFLDVSTKFTPGRIVTLRDYSQCFSGNLNLRGGVDINMIENLSSLEFSGFKNVPEKLASLGVRPKTLKEFADVTTSAYFTKKYGIDNDIRDLQEICRYIRSGNLGVMKYHKQVVKGHSSSINRYGGTCDFYTKALLVPGPGDPSLSERISNTLGLEATPAQLWAAVPFSFAIDWVVQLGSLLEKLDALAVAKTRFTCEYCLYTYVYRVPLPQDLVDYYLGSLEIIEPMQYIEYDRCISTLLPPPYLFPTKENMMGNHITEANALVINGLSH